MNYKNEHIKNKLIKIRSDPPNLERSWDSVAVRITLHTWSDCLAADVEEAWRGGGEYHPHVFLSFIFFFYVYKWEWGRAGKVSNSEKMRIAIAQKR